MSIAQHARAYATALDELEAVRTWMKSEGGHAGSRWKAPDLNVSWNYGSGLTGYKELQREVTRMVAEEMPDLLKRAQRAIDVRVRSAHRELEDAELFGRAWPHAGGRRATAARAAPHSLPRHGAGQADDRGRAYGGH